MESVKRNLFFNLMLVFSNITYPLLIFPYVSRVLGPAGIGESQFVLSFAKYFTLVAAIGLPIYGVREVAKVAKQQKQLAQLVSELLVLSVIASGVFSIIYAICVLALPSFKELQLLCWVAGLQIVLAFTSVDWFFYGSQQFKKMASRNIGMKFLTIGLILVCVQQPDDIVPYMLVSVLANLLLQCWNLGTVVKQTGLEFGNLQLQKHLKPLLIIFLTGVCTSAYTAFDTTLLGLLDSVESVGYYATSVRISKMMIPIVSSLSIVMIPKVVHEFGKQDATYSYHQKSFSFILELAIPLMVGLYLMAHEWIELLAGPGFEPAVTALQLLCSITLLVGLNNLFGIQVLSASGNERTLLVIVAIGMLLSLVLNIWLIPIWHHQGAALAMLVTEVFVTLATFYKAHQLYKIDFPWKSFGLSLIACLPFVGIVWLVRLTTLPEWGYTSLAVFACVAVYVFIQLYLFKNQTWVLFKNTVISYLN